MSDSPPSPSIDEPTDEFAPPRETSGRATMVGTVVLAWMLSGATIGLAIGLTAQLTGVDPRLTNPVGIGTIALMTAAGVVAIQVERSLAKSRPTVLSAVGQRERPLHAALFAIPLALATPAVLALIVVGSVAMDSLAPALFFGMGGFTLGWAARRVASSHGLTAALEALEVGDTAEAQRLLEGLEAGWLTTRNSRTAARLNLGMLALSAGDLDRASRYYRDVHGGPAETFARAGLALVYTLQDRLDEAEAAVLDAMGGSALHAVQGQIDTVRLLLVMRREDDTAARTFGEQVLAADAGELFLGLLALLRLRTGDEPGARDLCDATTRGALEESGWRTVIPEIAELLAEPALA
ncbi:MAG: hypothetical protein R3F61_10015 [Myxococcota bacterium]